MTPTAPIVYVDTNALVYFLAGGESETSRLARAAFQAAAEGRVQLFLADVIVVDLGFVLTRVLKLERSRASALLGALLDARGVRLEHRSLLRRTLELFDEYGLGWVDAYLAAHALEGGSPVLSFDRRLDRVPGLERVTSTSFPS